LIFIILKSYGHSWEKNLSQHISTTFEMIFYMVFLLVIGNKLDDFTRLKACYFKWFTFNKQTCFIRTMILFCLNQISSNAYIFFSSVCRILEIYLNLSCWNSHCPFWWFLIVRSSYIIMFIFAVRKCPTAAHILLNIVINQWSNYDVIYLTVNSYCLENVFCCSISVFISN
jgi:hypothetical protein